MKIYRLLLLTVVSCFALSCSQDIREDQATDDSNNRLAVSQFDNSHLGLYKGLFSTNDGLTRGSVELTLLPTNEAIAQITLSTGAVIELKSSRIKLTLDNTVENLRFSSVGNSPMVASLSFSVGGNGENPVISNVSLDNQDSDILIAKNLSRAPLNTITGTYMRTAGTGGFPTSGRTWNVMSVGADNQTYSTQIFYGGRLYNTTDSSNQTGCSDIGGGFDLCNINGSATILGYAVNWTGTHVYDNFVGDNFGCSEVDGTWSAPSYGGSSGTFTSDSDCSGLDIINDTCEGATDITCEGSVAGQTTGATASDEPANCDVTFNASPGVWFKVPAIDGLLTIDSFGSAFDTQIAIYAGTCDALVCIAGNDDSGSPQSQLTISSNSTDDFYYVYLTGYSPADFGAYVLNVSCQPYLGCGDQLIDDGGIGGPYSNNQTTFYIVDSGAGNLATLNFSEFAVEAGYDDMLFWDSFGTGGALITVSDLGTTATGPNGGFTGTQLASDGITSTGRYLTVAFVADNIFNDTGFVADVVCTPARLSTSPQSVVVSKRLDTGIESVKFDANRTSERRK